MRILRTGLALVLASGLSGCAGLTDRQLVAIYDAQKLHPWRSVVEGREPGGVWWLRAMGDLRPLTAEFCAAAITDLHVDDGGVVSQRADMAAVAGVPCLHAEPGLFAVWDGGQDANLAVALHAVFAADAVVDWGGVDPRIGRGWTSRKNLMDVRCEADGTVYISFGRFAYLVTVKEGKAVYIAAAQIDIITG